MRSEMKNVGIIGGNGTLGRFLLSSLSFKFNVFLFDSRLNGEEAEFLQLKRWFLRM